ncbi:ATP synthase subunit e, mitochondrial-like [Artemia franciscana]|uniref:ATP synthase F(0) complex subunit e, mitochondrial n=1 Tax=Artemia franciscana TaxID=6661 RepID=A0AA88HBT7_ARTSF|nr:hypothetical protein QYM36_016230 [Artemia franciscana]
MSFAPPVNVSPLIRAGRYGALVVGIVYGSYRFGSLQKRENEWRVEEARRKVIRDALNAENKAKATREEMLYLAKETGVKVPENF